MSNSKRKYRPIGGSSDKEQRNWRDKTKEDQTGSETGGEQDTGGCNQHDQTGKKLKPKQNIQEKKSSTGSQKIMKQNTHD